MSGEVITETRERRRARLRMASVEDRARGAWMMACGLAAREVGVDVREVVQTRGKPGRGSSNKVAMARKLACYVALIVSNVEPAVLARAAGLHRKTLSEHCLWVEDRRDDPRQHEFERTVQRMEDAVWQLCAHVVLTRAAPEQGEAA